MNVIKLTNKIINLTVFFWFWVLFFLFILFWTLRKKKQGWYNLTPEEKEKNYWKFWHWSDKNIKKIIKKRKKEKK